jgi:hypothetical protein
MHATPVADFTNLQFLEGTKTVQVDSCYSQVDWTSAEQISRNRFRRQLFRIGGLPTQRLWRHALPVAAAASSLLTLNPHRFSSHNLPIWQIRAQWRNQDEQTRNESTATDR